MTVRRALSVLPVLSVLVLVYLAWHALDRPVQTVVVSGEPTQAERQRVEEALMTMQLHGILSTDLSEIESQLRQMGWTRNVTVRRHWPDRIEVRLHKVMPVAKWGEEYYLAADGEPLALPDQYVGLPALDASISSPQQTMEVYRLLQLFASRQGLQIAVLSESPQGEWRVGFRNGMGLYLGARDVNQRMMRFLRAYGVAFKHQNQRIDYADARYTSGIAVRFKPVPTPEREVVGFIDPARGGISTFQKNNGS